MIYFGVKFQNDPLYGVFGFLSSNFMKFCRNIHPSVWQLLGLKKFKMSTVAMVTKVQKMIDSDFFLLI
jgi:hypothetical protein